MSDLQTARGSRNVGVQDQSDAAPIIAEGGGIRFIIVFGAALAIVVALLRGPWDPASQLVAALVLGLIALWILWVVIQDLWDVFGRIGLNRFLWLFGRATLLASPVFAIAWIAVDFTDTRTRALWYPCGSGWGGAYSVPAVSNIVWAREEGEDRFLLAQVPGKDGKPTVARSFFTWFACPVPEVTNDHEESVVMSLHRYTDHLGVDLSERVSNAVDEVNSQGLSGREAIDCALFGISCGEPENASAILPESLRDAYPLPETCEGFREWWNDPSPCISRETRYTAWRPLHIAYERRRALFLADWDEAAGSILSRTADTGEATERATDLFVERHLKAIAEEAESIARAGFSATGLLGLIGLFILGFALLKIWGYLFARLAFAPAPAGAGARLMFSPKSMLSSRSKVIFRHDGPGSVSLRATDDDANSEDEAKEKLTETWYVARKSPIDWRPKREVAWVARPGQLFLHRLRKGKLAWTRLPPEIGEIVGAYANDFGIAVVELGEGARLSVDFGRLEAFTETVQMQRYFSPRLGAFLRTNLFFTLVEGPGQIVISGRGGAVWQVGPGERIDYTESNQIIALDLDGTYSCRTLTSLRGIVESEAELQPDLGSGAVLLSHTEPRRGRIVRIGRFLLFLVVG